MEIENLNSSMPFKHEALKSWIRLPHSYVKLNTDGAQRETQGWLEEGLSSEMLMDNGLLRLQLILENLSQSMLIMGNSRGTKNGLV